MQIIILARATTVALCTFLALILRKNLVTTPTNEFVGIYRLSTDGM